MKGQRKKKRLDISEKQVISVMMIINNFEALKDYFFSLPTYLAVSIDFKVRSDGWKETATLSSSV